MRIDRMNKTLKIIVLLWIPSVLLAVDDDENQKLLDEIRSAKSECENSVAFLAFPIPETIDHMVVTSPDPGKKVLKAMTMTGEEIEFEGQVVKLSFPKRKGLLKRKRLGITSDKKLIWETDSYDTGIEYLNQVGEIVDENFHVFVDHRTDECFLILFGSVERKRLIGGSKVKGKDKVRGALKLLLEGSSHG